MAGVGSRAGLLVNWTGVLAAGLGGGLWGICVEGTMVTIGGIAVGVRVGTLGEGAGQSVSNTTEGEGCSALRAVAVGGLTVAFDNMRESVWMEAN